MPVDHERRRVLHAIVTGALGLAAGGASAQSAPSPARSGSKGTADSPKALVARGRREKILDEKGGVDRTLLDAALGASVAAAAAEKGPVEAMRRLFKPGDVVGIKVNTLSGKGLSPRPEVVAALAGWLEKGGVPARNIVVWDRTDRELNRAGLTVNRDGPGVRCFGTNEDYDWTPREWGPGASCFARLLVRDLTALINVGVIKDHDLAGVSVGLKNWYGAIHNPNKHHEDGCNPFVAHLAAFPLVRDKVRLTVVDGLTAQCHGGPARQPRWSWPWGGVLVSTDPVAIDSVGCRLIEERRTEVGLPSLAEEKREPRYIRTAAELGLGVADLARIRVVDV